MKINKRNVAEEDLYFWVEEGQGSLGNFNTALEFIDAAAVAGADGIEFQLAIPEEFYISSHPMIEHYKKIRYEDAQIKKLIEKSHSSGLDFIAAVLSPSLIPKLCDYGCDAFVINASDINNPGIVDPVIESGVPFFISLPLASPEEIEWVVQRCKSKRVNDFVLMLGQHTMASGEHGVMPEDSNLGYLQTLKDKYDLLVGYIDHSASSFMPAVSRAAGATFISKHIVLNKEEKGPDWFVAQEPGELKETIDLARKVNQSLSAKEKVLAPGENMDVKLMRRSIVSAESIPKGAVITSEMLAFKRPGTGLPPNLYEDLLGKRAAENIQKDEIINFDQLEQ